MALGGSKSWRRLQAIAVRHSGCALSLRSGTLAAGCEKRHPTAGRFTVIYSVKDRRAHVWRALKALKDNAAHAG